MFVHSMMEAGCLWRSFSNVISLRAWESLNSLLDGFSTIFQPCKKEQQIIFNMDLLQLDAQARPANRSIVYLDHRSNWFPAFSVDVVVAMWLLLLLLPTTWFNSYNSLVSVKCNNIFAISEIYWTTCVHSDKNSLCVI